MRARRLYVHLVAWIGGAMMVACSNSGSALTLDSGPPVDAGSGAMAPSVLTGLQQVVAAGKTFSSVPSDLATQKVAAQIVQLQYDRTASLNTAALIQKTEADPNYKGNKTFIESSRQASLAQAATDLTQIQALQQTNVPGTAALNQDGGAANVINAIVVQAFAAQAEAILKSKNPPSADAISNYLQEVSVVLGDQGSDGHDVASQLVVQALLSDGGLARVDASVQ